MTSAIVAGTPTAFTIPPFTTSYPCSNSITYSAPTLSNVAFKFYAAGTSHDTTNDLYS